MKAEPLPKTLKRYLAMFRALERLYTGERLEEESRRLMEQILSARKR